MSRYDEEYQAHFTGLRGYKLWAHGTFYAGDILYNPIRPEILVGPPNRFGHYGQVWLNEITKLASQKKANLTFKKIRQLYRRFELSDLAQHPAIVIFPYAVMSYSIVDFYAANLPIFVPSIEIMSRNRNVYDRTIGLRVYCGDKITSIEPDEYSKHGGYDPNSNNESDYM